MQSNRKGLSPKAREQMAATLAGNLRRVEDVLAEGHYTDAEDIAMFTAHANRLRERIARLVAA